MGLMGEYEVHNSEPKFIKRLKLGTQLMYMHMPGTHTHTHTHTHTIVAITMSTINSTLKP